MHIPRTSHKGIQTPYTMCQRSSNLVALGNSIKGKDIQRLMSQWLEVWISFRCKYKNKKSTRPRMSRLTSWHIKRHTRRTLSYSLMRLFSSTYWHSVYSVELTGVEPVSKRGTNPLSTCLSSPSVFVHPQDRSHQRMPYPLKSHTRRTAGTCYPRFYHTTLPDASGLGFWVMSCLSTLCRD